MLERLESIDWTGLESAAGPATEVPLHLRELLSDDASVRERAIEWLWWCLCHQTTIYAATLYAVPFLLELLSAPAFPEQSAILDLLAGIAEGAFPRRGIRADGTFYDLDQEEVARWERRIHAAVRAGRDRYLRLLDDHALETRRSALNVLLSGLPNDAEQVERAEQVVAAIRRCCALESDRALRMQLVRCLSLFTPVADETRTLLAHIRAYAADPLARLAATGALAHMDGEGAPEGAETDLVHALVAPDPAMAEEYSGLMIDEHGFLVHLDYMVDLALALRAMGPRGMRAALPSLVEALAARCARATQETLPVGRIVRRTRVVIAANGKGTTLDSEGRLIYPLTCELQLAETLLVLTFGRRRSGAPLPGTLGPEHVRALDAISVCDALWYYDANMDALLSERGLPPTRTGITDPGWRTGQRGETSAAAAERRRGHKAGSCNVPLS